MAYYRKRRYYKKKAPAKPGRIQIYGAAGKQLYKDVMYLKTLINSEPKYHDSFFSTTFNYAGYMTPNISTIAQGDGDNNRDGNRILPRFLTLRGSVRRSLSGTVTEHTVCRIIVFRWWGEDPNAVGVAPVPGDIIEGVSDAYSPYKPLSDRVTGPKGDRNRRIEVHRTELFTLDSVSRTSYDFDYNIQINGPGKKNKEHIEFYNNTTAPPTSGGFYLMIIGNHATSADTTMTGMSKLVFYDN